jgi:hypothetical protein
MLKSAGKLTMNSKFLLGPLLAVSGMASTAFSQTASDPIQLPTGALLTPIAAPRSVYQTLNPGLTDLPNFVAGQPVTTA